MKDEPQQAEQAEQPASKAEAELDAQFKALHASVTAQFTPDAIASVADAYLSGAEVDLANVARASGLSSEEASKHLQTAETLYHAHAEALAQRVGVDYDQFQEWSATHPKQSAEAIRHIIHGGDFSKFQLGSHRLGPQGPP